ncbi:MAG: heme-dependent oxidative N-demethylase subunit alpha family protein [Burkholderiaceae bacterium]
MTGLSSPVDPLGLAQVPFPVMAPFRMQPGLCRIDDPLAGALRPSSDQALAHSQKAVAVAIQQGRLPLLSGESSGLAGQSGSREVDDLAHALSLIKQALAPSADQNNQSQADDPAGRNPLLIAAQTLRSQMQDDFVLMTAVTDKDSPPDLRASLMAVAMPSGWRPADKLGQGFLQLHQPVADAALIRRAAPSLCAMMRAPGGLRRHVWTLCGAGQLSRHPDDEIAESVRTIENLWFRCERQTSYAMLDGAVVVFLIRIYTAPLVPLLAVAPDRAATLCAALESMSDAVLSYKSLEKIRPIVLRALGDRTTG